MRRSHSNISCLVVLISLSTQQFSLAEAIDVTQFGASMEVVATIEEQKKADVRQFQLLNESLSISSFAESKQPASDFWTKFQYIPAKSNIFKFPQATSETIRLSNRHQWIKDNIQIGLIQYNTSDQKALQEGGVTSVL
jgi:hypothetical protein